MLERNYYNWAVSDLVSKIHKDIFAIFKNNNIAKIYFYQHEDVLEDSIPYVTFYDDDFNASSEELGEITLGDNGEFVYVSRNGKYSAFTDGYYGDYFDVAESLPKIYAAICDIINAEDIKPNEME